MPSSGKSTVYSLLVKHSKKCGSPRPMTFQPYLASEGWERGMLFSLRLQIVHAPLLTALGRRQYTCRLVNSNGTGKNGTPMPAMGLFFRFRKVKVQHVHSLQQMYFVYRYIIHVYSEYSLKMRDIHCPYTCLSDV